MATTVQPKAPPSRSGPTGIGTGMAGYLFIAPSLIFIAVFVIGPIVGALWFSFTDYDLMSSPKFIGLRNFERLFDDDRFTRSMTNSLFFAFGTVPSGVITSLLLAALINRQIRGIYTFRAMFYLPVVSSFVSVSLIWLWFYEPNFGIANEMLEMIGLPRLKFMRSASTAMLSIIIMSVWKNMGLNMIIYLAGLQGIPPHLYESSEIDGAGRVAQFFKITVPLLAPTTFFVVIVYFIGALQMFVQVFVMTQSSANTSEWAGPLDSTLTVVVLVYQNAFEYLRMGYASAISFMLLLVAAVVTLINVAVLRYDVGW